MEKPIIARDFFAQHGNGDGEIDDPRVAGTVIDMAAKVRLAQKIIDNRQPIIRQNITALHESPSWKEKIIFFLGKLPDSDVAKILEADKAFIQRLRIKNRIKPYSFGDELGKIVEALGGLRPKANNKDCS